MIEAGIGFVAGLFFATAWPTPTLAIRAFVQGVYTAVKTKIGL